jgi:ATP-dependent clp protease, ATP-binding subunit clpB
MEENQKIIKSYYNLSEDQLSRLKTLLDRVVTKENLDITVPYTDAKRRKIASMLLAFFAIILSLTGFGTVILILAVIIMPPLLYFVLLIIATLYLWLIWGIPILGILFCHGFIRFSRQEETNAFVTVAYTILSKLEGVHRSSLSQEVLQLKYFMSALKQDAESNQKDKQREDFRISRLKQLLRKINPTRKDLPESEWETSKLALKWVVLASSILSLVIGLRFLYVFFEGLPTISGFVWFILPFLGAQVVIIIIYKLLLQFQKKKAQQELTELLQIAKEEAQRIKKQPIELPEELIQELDDCVYELSQAYGMTV